MGKNKKLEKQKHDLYVKFPSLILSIYLEERANHVGNFNNEIKDNIIKRIDSVYQDVIKTIEGKDY